MSGSQPVVFQCLQTTVPLFKEGIRGGVERSAISDNKTRIA